MSSQCCFLPIQNGCETSFNISLYNYQSKEDDPKILTIVVSNNGTSAQICNKKPLKLYFNQNGKKATFIGQRLTDNRKERGVENKKKKKM